MHKATRQQYSVTSAPFINTEKNTNVDRTLPTGPAPATQLVAAFAAAAIEQAQPQLRKVERGYGALLCSAPAAPAPCDSRGKSLCKSMQIQKSEDPLLRDVGWLVLVICTQSYYKVVCLDKS